MTHQSYGDFRQIQPAVQPLTRVAPVPGTPRLSTIPLFGLDIVDASPDAAIAALLAPGRRRVAFFNAHCGNVMAQDAGYAEALATADLVLPDGIGVELAARMTGQHFTANLNGTDLVPALMAEAATRGLSVFLLGAAPGVAEAAAANLARANPGLRIAGTLDGFAGAAETGRVVTTINASGADILLVAMGVPMQDRWLFDQAGALSPRLMLGVGALFDFLAGQVRRAPAAVRRARMEWAWRLAMEPRRMARRYLVGNASFLCRAAWHALTRHSRLERQRRLLDLGLASTALILLAPLLALIALAIRIESPGAALFRQTRIGRDGRAFTIYKFRSMYRDAEARRAALLASSDRAGLCFKSKTDPRITRVGALLRRFSLDELPQLLNILKGDMAVVGPRPALPQEVAAYPAHALERLRVKPGLTGLWQVSGRAEVSFERMVQMDIAYARSTSILLDLVLIGLTFRALWTGRGAC